MPGWRESSQRNSTQKEARALKTELPKYMERVVWKKEDCLTGQIVKE